MSPDTRQHRGAHPADRELFHEVHVPPLRTAVAELSWLLSRGYSPSAALKLVGDRYSLKERQRLAISRAAASDQSLDLRKASRQPPESIAGQAVIIDGFNLIITVEAALSGGVLLSCRDGCIRDLSSVYGSYRAVSETESAIVLIGETLAKLRAGSVEWLLDRPISNSGRLAKRIRDLAQDRDWPWSVELSFNPDKKIISSEKIAITSDSAILDRVARWANLKRYLIAALPSSWLVDLNSSHTKPSPRQ